MFSSCMPQWPTAVKNFFKTLGTILLFSILFVVIHSIASLMAGESGIIPKSRHQTTIFSNVLATLSLEFYSTSAGCSPRSLANLFPSLIPVDTDVLMEVVFSLWPR